LEHLLFLLIEFILWVDRRSLRPLDKLVSNLSELRAQPAVVLAQGDITIGPVRRWGSGIALGLLLAVGLLGFMLLLFFAANGRPPWVGRGRLAVVLPLAFLIGVPLFSVLFMLYRLKGARMVLRSGGVELHDRGTTVICPWALFSAQGVPFQPSKDRVLLPINAAAVQFVEAHRDDRLLAQGGRIRTRALRFKTANLAEMRSLYEVEIPELANLLLHLGRLLAAPLPSATPDHLAPAAEPLAAAPTLVQQADGWLKASLVHLTFPPYCCDCGRYTPERKEYQGYRGSLEAGDCAKLQVPVCTTCQEDSTQSWRKALVIGLAIGLLSGFLLGALICVLAGDPRMLVMAIPLSVLGILFGAAIGNGVGKSLASPVRLRGYAPEEGTMLLLFRNPAYADALLEINGGVAEEEPDEDEDEADATDDVYSER
jgi:hypothetical protein